MIAGDVTGGVCDGGGSWASPGPEVNEIVAIKLMANKMHFLDVIVSFLIGFRVLLLNSTTSGEPTQYDRQPILTRMGVAQADALL